MDKNERLIKETRLLYELFNKTNFSDKKMELFLKNLDKQNKTVSKHFEYIKDMSSATIGRRLTNIENYKIAFPYNFQELFDEVQAKRQENLYNGKKTGAKNSHLKYSMEYNTSKISLRDFKLTDNQLNNLLTHIILSFRIHVDTLSKLLDISEDALKRRIVDTNYGNNFSSKAIEFILNKDVSDQEVATQKFLNFYFNYVNAEGKEALNELLKTITDHDAKILAEKRISGDPLNDEELLTMLKFQLKYVLAQHELEAFFKVDSGNYRRRLNKLFEDTVNDEMKSYYEYVTDYNKSFYSGGKSR